eukprot:Sspe_Gene.65866::Locus_38945_Transcript_1_1_Confidence_1.000_Length_2807::g.65866::m.65866
MLLLSKPLRSSLRAASTKAPSWNYSTNAAPKKHETRAPSLKEKARGMEQAYMKKFLDEYDLPTVSGSPGKKAGKFREYLRKTPLRDIRFPHVLHDFHDAADFVLQKEFISEIFLKQREEGVEMDDDWCSRLLIAVSLAVKKCSESEMRNMVEEQKNVLDKLANNAAFRTGTQCYNAVLWSMYESGIAVERIFEFYKTNYFSKDAANPRRPNAKTFGLMFSVCLKEHYDENTKKFFDACCTVLSNDKVTYNAKMQTIKAMGKGLITTRNVPYAIKLHDLLAKLYKDGGLPATLPDRNRKSQHLYIDSQVADLLFYQASLVTSPLLVDCMSQWLTVLKQLVPQPSYFTHFIKACARARDLKRGFSTWEEVVERKMLDGSFLPACTFLLDSLSRNRGESDKEFMGRASEMIDTMREKELLSIEETEGLYNLELKVNVVRGDYPTALNIYEDMKKKKILTTDNPFITFCTGIKAKEKENFAIVQRVFNDSMERERADKDKPNGFRLSDLAINRYIGVLADRGDSEEVLEIINQRFSEPTLEQYHKVLDACSRGKSASSYGTFYHKTSEKQDDVPLYFSHLKNRRAAAENCNVARRVFDKMKERGVAITGETYNRLMAVYASAGKFQEVQSLYAEMHEKNIRADEHTYHSLIRAGAERGEVASIDNFVQELIGLHGKERKKKTKLTDTICALILKALANTGEPIDTLAYTRRYMDDEELDWTEPDTKAVVVRAYRPRTQEVKAGFDIVEAYNSSGGAVSEKVLGALMALCLRAGHAAHAEAVWDQIKTKDLYSKPDLLTHLMKMYHVKGDAKNAVKHLEEVIMDGGSVYITAFLNCLSVCAAQGDVANTERVLKHMLHAPNTKVSDMAIAQGLIACARSREKGLDTKTNIDPLAKAREILEVFRSHHEKDPNK